MNFTHCGKAIGIDHNTMLIMAIPNIPKNIKPCLRPKNLLRQRSDNDPKIGSPAPSQIVPMSIATPISVPDIPCATVPKYINKDVAVWVTIQYPKLPAPYITLDAVDIIGFFAIFVFKYISKSLNQIMLTLYINQKNLSSKANLQEK